MVVKTASMLVSGAPARAGRGMMFESSPWALGAYFGPTGLSLLKREQNASSCIARTGEDLGLASGLERLEASFDAIVILKPSLLFRRSGHFSRPVSRDRPARASSRPGRP